MAAPTERLDTFVIGGNAELEREGHAVKGVLPCSNQLGSLHSQALGVRGGAAGWSPVAHDVHHRSVSVSGVRHKQSLQQALRVLRGPAGVGCILQGSMAE